MQSIAVRQSFDRHDAISIVHDGESQAGVHPPAVDQNSASSALAVVAAFLRAGQVQALAQCVEERDTRLEVERVPGSIHFKLTHHSAKPKSANSEALAPDQFRTLVPGRLHAVMGREALDPDAHSFAEFLQTDFAAVAEPHRIAIVVISSG
jgi:hypothetical protein